MKRILLCELNVSEGRNKEALDKITAALESSPDIKVIDKDSEPNHNRSVYTIKFMKA